MPRPLEICLEDLALAPEDDRYLRCVALPGGERGLGLSPHGTVSWMPDGPAAYQLWVSADDQLMLVRGEGSGAICIRRGGRSLVAPPSRPVVLLSQDLLQVEGKTLRVHIHGPAASVYAPEPIRGRALRQLLRAMAAALALGTTAGAAIEARAADPIEVRHKPPAPRRVIKVVCTIVSLTPRPKNQSLVVARCSQSLRVGARGYIVDAAHKGVNNGVVVVTKVNGLDIEAETPLKDASRAKYAIFRW